MAYLEFIERKSETDLRKRFILCSLIKGVEETTFSIRVKDKLKIFRGCRLFLFFDEPILLVHSFEEVKKALNLKR